MSTAEQIDDKQIDEALDRIARDQPIAGDGQKLYLYAQLIAMDVIEGLDGGALHQNEGRRSLARDLMAKMAAGIEAANSGRRERPILYKRSEPVIVDTGFGARRRITVAGRAGGQG